MNEIKIFVTHTPNTNNICPKIPLCYHVTAGSVFQQGPLPKGMLRDDTGEHISDRNRRYCELTTQYWAWKNVTADIYGFCHYRRYFSFAPGLLPHIWIKRRAKRCACGKPTFAPAWSRMIF